MSLELNQSVRNETTPETGRAGSKEDGLTPANRKRARVRVASIIASFCHLLILGLVSWGNSEGPERAWWSTLNIYLPQFMWALPVVILLPVLGVVARKWLWLPVISLLWVAGPIMGFHWHSSRNGPLHPRARLRVMTYNAAGRADSPLVVEEIERTRPDLVFLQEVLQPPAEFRNGWHTAGPFGGCFVASRTPLTGVEDRILRLAPDWRRYVRCKTEVNGVSITLYGLHLDTPREAIESIRERKLSGISALEDDTATRLFRAAGVAESLLQESGPIVLAGDLNAPEPSLICRTLELPGLHDAFDEAGRGYGYTFGHAFRLGISYIRIDHILVSKPWVVESCRTGGAEGSDHRPVIADLYIDE